MAQTKRKRRRKHKGTPAGTIERPARSQSRPRTREEARQIARQRRQDRLSTPPSWRSSMNRAAIAALVFGVLIVVAFGRDMRQGAFLALLMFVIYIPLGYATDTVIYRVRQRRSK